MIDSTVDRGTLLEGVGRIPQVEREAQGLAVEPLRQDNAFGLSIGEVVTDDRDRAHALRGFMGGPAIDCDDTWAFLGNVKWVRKQRLMTGLPSSGEKRIADTAIYCGSAGGGVAIMLTPL